jgi:phage protein D/phage baseplate assembly protein gpV
MPPAKLDSNVTIKVNGVALSTADLVNFVELTVDSDYYLPTMFDFTLYDDAQTYIDGDKFKVGNTVVISVDAAMEVDGASVKGDLVDGVITSLEATFSEDIRCSLHVRGYDRGYKLMSGEKTRVFGGGTKGSITESNIFSTVSGDAGLSAQVDSGLSSIQGAYVMQYAQTNWDFLWGRARRLGYQMYVSGSKLCVSKANVLRDGCGEVELEWGVTLGSFEPRVSIVGQADKAVATGWDIEKKEKVSSEVKDGTLSVNLIQTSGLSGKTLSSNYSDTALCYLEEPGLDAGTAQKIADARLSALESNVLQASGSMPCGNPKVVAGAKVKIAKIGKKFSGTYFVTHARHIFSNGEYRIDFEVSETTPHTLSGLLGSSVNDRGWRLVDGVVIGVVTNNSDPDKLGRVKVKFPWLPANGAELESFWARLASVGGGKERGVLFMPEVDDEVLVAFEHGDINMPFILGGLWNKKDTPPDGSSAELVSGGKVDQRVIRSRSGHLILLNDKSGEEQILIQDKSKKNSILINSKDNAMTLSCQKDFTIEAGGNFTVKAKGDVLFDAPGKFEITSIKSLSVTALQEALMKVSNSQLALKPTGSELSGAQVDVKATAKVSVSGSAMAEIKGGLVKIN